MKNKALSTIINYNMLTCGDNVTVGLSGGADSVALLVFLCELKEAYALNLTACHVNHCLRADESDRDEEFCKALCERLNIPISIYRVDAANYSKERRVSIEVAARELRYDAFADCRGEGLIATAHTLSDNLETILLSMGRGTGLKGLTGIPPIRDHIIRPLLACTRGEVERYLGERGFSYVTDSSNLTDDYSRNKLRHNVIPQLKAALPDIESSVARMVSLLEQDHNYLELSCTQSMEQITLDDGYSKGLYMALHPAIRSRILIKLLQEHNQEYSLARVQLLENALVSGSDKIELSTGCYFTVEADRFKIERSQNSQKLCLEPIVLLKDALNDTAVQFGDKTIRFSTHKHHKKLEISNKKNTTFAMDYDKIERVLFIRTRLEGDKISLAGRNCSKSLKKLVNEQRIPLEARQSLAVIADEAGVLAVEGCGLAERCAPSPLTKTILLIEFDDKG